jgi:hypothetical protein
MFHPGTFFAQRAIDSSSRSKVCYVELDSLLRDRPRLLRLVRTRLDVPALPRLRAQIAGMERVRHQAVADPKKLTGALTLRAGAGDNDASTLMSAAQFSVITRPEPLLVATPPTAPQAGA